MSIQGSFCGMLSISQSDNSFYPVFLSLVDRLGSATDTHRILYGNKNNNLTHNSVVGSNLANQLVGNEIPIEFLMLTYAIDTYTVYGFDIPERNAFIASDCVGSDVSGHELGRKLAYSKGGTEEISLSYNEIIHHRLFTPPIEPVTFQLGYLSHNPTFILGNTDSGYLSVYVIIHKGNPHIVWFSSALFAETVLAAVNKYETDESIFISPLLATTLHNSYLVLNPLHLSSKYHKWKRRFREQGGMFTAVGCLRKYLFNNVRSV